MYEQFYGFSALPFAGQPVAGEFYFCPLHQRVMDELAERTRQGRCLCLLSGAAGVGKSSLVQVLADSLRASVSVSLLDAHNDSETSLSDRLLADLGLTCDGSSPGAATACLATHLQICRDTGRPAVLIVEHAERLSAHDCATLGELAGSEGEPLLQMIFVTARPENWAAAGDNACGALAQRVQEHYPLLPLSPIETDSYIRQRVTQAAGSPDLFTASASGAVYQYSRGVPRLINRVCDLALVYGSSRDAAQIDAETLGFVLNDRWGGGQQKSAPAAGAVNVQPAAAVPGMAGVPVLQAADRPVSADAAVAVTQPATTDTLLAQKLLELLKQGNDNREPAPRQVSERDLYDFIRLSLRYHQRHVERFTLGIVVGVALLAAAGLWTFITWQNEDLMPSAAASYTGGDRVAAETDRGRSEPLFVPAPVIPEPVKVVHRESGQDAVPAVALPAEHLPPPSMPKAGQPIVATPAPPAAPTVEASASKSDEAAERAENARLQRNRDRLKKELATQRAEQERLKKANAEEFERAEQAKLLVREARKSARAAWDSINTSRPDALPEE